MPFSHQEVSSLQGKQTHFPITVMEFYLNVLFGVMLMFAWINATSSLSTSKELSDFGISKDVLDKCMKSAKIKDEARALDMVNPASNPEEVEDMCLVECIYDNYPVGFSGDYKLKNDADKEWTIALNDEKTDPKRHNSVVQQCLERATFIKDSGEKRLCEKGAVIRMCHQQFSRLFSELMAHLVKQEEFNP